MKAPFPTLLLIVLLCTCVRAQKTFPTPVNDIVPERTNLDRGALSYARLREADILWQKRTWRVIDVREKINHPFVNPNRPLIDILLDAAKAEEIQLYSAIDDKFSTPLSAAEKLSISGGMDTIPVVDPDTQETYYEVVPRIFNAATVTRYRVQEIWYVDRNTSRMHVRILGLAPIVDESGENDEFRIERPLFWVYFPAARPTLAAAAAYVAENGSASRSWDDVFQLRLFDSHVIKEENVHDLRIEDYVPDSRTRLIVGRRMEQERLGRESDLWSH
ncbi:MAG: gliding motility protein GldN [Bacteroidota bacterium]